MDHSDRHRHIGRSVRDPVARYGKGWGAVRADHAGLLRHAFSTWVHPSRQGAGDYSRNAQPSECDQLFLDRRFYRVYRVGFGGACSDGRRGVVCRYGPFRAQADCGQLVMVRASCLDAQLYGSGSNDPVDGRGYRCHNDQGSFLPDDP